MSRKAVEQYILSSKTDLIVAYCGLKPNWCFDISLRSIWIACSLDSINSSKTFDIVGNRPMGLHDFTFSCGLPGFCN